MAILDWANANIGKTHLDPDPPNGIDGECVNAASSALMYQGGPELFGSGTDDTAWDIWQTFTHPSIQKIENAPDNAPSPGDAVFYEPNHASTGTGDAGHVNVAIDNISTNSYRGADANWNDNRALEFVNHGYDGVAGWFHVINQAPAGSEGDNEVPISADDVNNLYQELLGRSADGDAGAGSWVGLPFHDAYYGIKDSDEGKARSQAVTAALGTAVQLPALQQQVSDLQAQVASLTTQAQSLEKQLAAAQSAPAPTPAPLTPTTETITKPPSVQPIPPPPTPPAKISPVTPPQAAPLAKSSFWQRLWQWLKG